MNAVLKQTDPATRYNIYRVIHKGLRAFMADTLLTWGRVDVNDDAECAEAVKQLRGLLTLCKSHLDHENQFVHPALEQARRGAAKRTAEDHVHHEQAIAKLEEEVARFEAAPITARAVLADRLYLHLSKFIAENFEHMLTEEIDNQAELIAAYDDAEIMNIEHAIVATLGPEEAYVGQYWMIPNMNATERAAVVGGIKQNAPREVFEMVLGIARERLTQRDFFKLERALA